MSCKLIYVIKNIHRISFNPHELEEVSIQTKFRGRLKPNFIKCLNYYEFKYFWNMTVSKFHSIGYNICENGIIEEFNPSLRKWWYILFIFISKFWPKLYFLSSIFKNLNSSPLFKVWQFHPSIYFLWIPDHIN